MEEESFHPHFEARRQYPQPDHREAPKAIEQISGDDAFKLKDTYGLPIEEILLIAKDSDLQVDEERYQHLEQEAKERSRSSQKVTSRWPQKMSLQNLHQTTWRTCNFLGYHETAAEGKVTALVVDGRICR